MCGRAEQLALVETRDEAVCEALPPTAIVAGGIAQRYRHRSQPSLVEPLLPPRKCPWYSRLVGREMVAFVLSCPHTSDQRTQNIRDMLEDVISSSFRQHTSGPYFFLFARRPSILAGERLARGRDRPLHVAKVGPDAGLDPKLLAQVQASRPGNEPGNEPGLVQSCQAATLARFGCVDVKGPTKNIGPRVRTEVDPRHG